MPSLRLSRRLLALLSFCLSNLPSGVAQEPYEIKFKFVKDMIVVPVTINGAGPFDFLVDTGSTDTIIDRKLAVELHLPPAGKMIVETTEGEAVTPLVQTDSLSMGGATVRGLNLGVVNHYADFLPKVRGSLGEDFLRSFDILIDNRRHLIHFEFGAGSLADMFTGERLPLSVNGSYDQELTGNRLVVVGRIFELGNKDVKLQLGEKVFIDLTVFVPTAKIPPMDVDGLLPTALFRSIFISHSGRFVILDPSTRNTAIAQSKSTSRQDPANIVARSMRIESPE
jgi:hypothetical protein